MDITKLDTNGRISHFFGDDLSLEIVMWADNFKDNTEDEFNEYVETFHYLGEEKRRSMGRFDYRDYLKLWNFLGQVLSQIKMPDSFTNNEMCSGWKLVYGRLSKVFKEDSNAS